MTEDGISLSCRIGGEEYTAIYTIIRVYEAPENRIEATERMLEAIMLHTENDYHVQGVGCEPGAKPGQGRAVDLKPPTGWLRLIYHQLTGNEL